MRNAVKPTKRDRAQSEPLAALISVAVICAAISVYVGVFGSVIPTFGTERNVAEPVADSIWQDLSENNLYLASRNVSAAVERASLPTGYHATVEITIVGDDGSIVTVGSVTFDGSGSITGRPTPSDATTVERAVAVKRRPGDVRPGRFVVEVWE